MLATPRICWQNITIVSLLQCANGETAAEIFSSRFSTFSPQAFGLSAFTVEGLLIHWYFETHTGTLMEMHYSRSLLKGKYIFMSFFAPSKLDK